MESITDSSRVCVVTVNYKTPDHTCAAIESLATERQFLPNVQMIVVDNHSQDDSCEKIGEFIRSNGYDWVELIAAERNGGYAYGNNLALTKLLERSSEWDFIWLLNPDTKLRKGAGLALVTFLAKNPGTIAGSRLEDEDGTVQISSFKFPNPIGEFCGALKLGVFDRLFKSKLIIQPLGDESAPCDWLAGASLMMSSKTLQSMGLMDQVYFLYYEELDWLLNAHRKGHICWYVPESRIFHAVGASTGISDSRKKMSRRPTYWFDSRRRYFIKNYSKTTVMLVDIASILGYSLWFTRMALTRRSALVNEPPRFLRDMIRHSFLFRGFKL